MARRCITSTYTRIPKAVPLIHYPNYYSCVSITQRKCSILSAMWTLRRVAFDEFTIYHSPWIGKPSHKAVMAKGTRTIAFYRTSYHFIDIACLEAKHTVSFSWTLRLDGRKCWYYDRSLFSCRFFDSFLSRPMWDCDTPQASNNSTILVSVCPQHTCLIPPNPPCCITLCKRPM